VSLSFSLRAVGCTERQTWARSKRARCARARVGGRVDGRDGESREQQQGAMAGNVMGGAHAAWRGVADEGEAKTCDDERCWSWSGGSLSWWRGDKRGRCTSRRSAGAAQRQAPQDSPARRALALERGARRVWHPGGTRAVSCSTAARLAAARRSAPGGGGNCRRAARLALSSRCSPAGAASACGGRLAPHSLDMPSSRLLSQRLRSRSATVEYALAVRISTRSSEREGER
jgi:hypothetical protein